MITTDTDVAEKIRENRLRRMLHRQGYGLRKTRRRDPRAYDYGTYSITTEGPGGGPYGNAIVYGCDQLSLDQVEAWALREPADAL